jgi:hypothetical protein
MRKTIAACFNQHEVKGTRQEIVRLEQKIKESRGLIVDLESGVNEYDDYKREIEQCFTEDDRKAIEKSMRERFLFGSDDDDQS